MFLSASKLAVSAADFNRLSSKHTLSRQKPCSEPIVGDRIPDHHFACPLAVQYRFVAAFYNDFERHPCLHLAAGMRERASDKACTVLVPSARVIFGRLIC